MNNLSHFPLYSHILTRLLNNLQAAFVLNRSGVQFSPLSQVVSELTGVSAALLLFADGLLKAFPSSPDLASTSSSTNPSYVSLLKNTLPDASSGKAQLLADSLIQSIQGTLYVLVADEEGRALQVGPSNVPVLTKDQCRSVWSLLNEMPQLQASEGVSTAVSTDSQERRRISSCLPDLGSVSLLARDSRGWVWVLLADNPELGETGSSSSRRTEGWIADLLSAPC